MRSNAFDGDHCPQMASFQTKSRRLHQNNSLSKVAHQFGISRQNEPHPRSALVSDDISSIPASEAPVIRQPIETQGFLSERAREERLGHDLAWVQVSLQHVNGVDVEAHPHQALGRIDGLDHLLEDGAEGEARL